MNLTYKSYWDLYAIIIISALLLFSILLVPDFWLRLIIGLPFLLFFPGYVAVAALFPERKSMGMTERLALSLGLSIAITPLIGFALNYTTFGIRLEPILFSITLFNFTLSIVSFWRRSNVKEPYLPFDPKTLFASLASLSRAEKGLDKALSIVLVISIVSSVAALAFVVAIPKEGNKFTEFYILGPNGKASGYPHNLTVGENASVIVGIANHELRKVHYIVQSWLVNASFADNQTTIHHMYYFDSFDVVLNHTAVDLEAPWTVQWQQNYGFNVSIDGEYKLWFFLFKDTVPEYAQGLTRMGDYAGSSTDFLIQNAVQDKLLSLNISLQIS
jgi:uncharacterized membrane protein